MNTTLKATFNIGIVGFGIGKTHAWAFNNIPYYFNGIDAKQINIVGISTAREKTAQSAAKKFDFSFSTDDYTELVNHPDVDIVCVAVPDVLHAPVTKVAIQAGKHVYCEKPLAFDLIQAKETTQLAIEAGIVHQMAFQMRFGPAIIEAKKIIENGQLGELFTFRCVYQDSGYEDHNRPFSWS